ncbi:hypothetical protein DFH08DRAFT_996107 [Mycena albidolilacea]|uniref:DUF6533 domain-containing protein n=1 Tax=Mycena albidolilacea TaxID=1033008 RepID=A0AAD6YXM2_9AGAR|nr:hypothetical protein DFH08DRAFT_996107 [Mycena albidolilacea]
MDTLDDVVFAQDQRLRISVSLAGFNEIPKIHVLTAVFIYDYLLTLSSEVMYIWVRGNELGSAWFLLIRYSAILGNIAEAFLLFGNFSPETCNRLDTVHGLLVVALEFAVAWTLMLRVYAMYSRNKPMLAFWISACLLLVGIAVVGDLYFALLTTNANLSWISGTAVVWEALYEQLGPPSADSKALLRLGLDLIILGLTLYRGFQQLRGPTLSGSLWQVLIRDGELRSLPFSVSDNELNIKALCISGERQDCQNNCQEIHVKNNLRIITLANLANILIQYIRTSGSLSWFSAMLSVVMVSRLMLNLHSAADPNTEFDGSSTAQTRSIHFARIHIPGESSSFA